MANRREIHSTEKLLDVIRNNNSPAANPSENTPAVHPGNRRNMIRSISGPKKFTVGVDIGHTYVKLAKVARLSAKNWELVDYLTVRPDGSFATEDPKFLDLLKSTLNKFCGEDARLDIWSAIPSAKVETRCLRIPKLPRKQIANAIYWTFTKTVAFNDTEELLDYEILGDVTEQSIKKTEVLTYKVPKKEVADLKSVFKSIGYPLRGISIAPFAIQNLLRADIIKQEASDICSLFVGRSWSRIAIFSNNNLVLSRGIKTGMQSMVDCIQQSLIDGGSRQRPTTESPMPFQANASESTAPTVNFLGPDMERIMFLRLPGCTAGVFSEGLAAGELLLRMTSRSFSVE